MSSDRPDIGVATRFGSIVLAIVVLASVAVAGPVGTPQPSAATGDAPANQNDALAANGEPTTVLDPGTAALSGFASTGEKGRLAGATVWVQVVQIQGAYTILFVPDDPADPTEFTVELLSLTGAVIERATVDAERLRVGSEGYDFADFENVSSDESYTVWTTIDRNPNDATYTFPRLPSADSSGVDSVTYTVRSAHDRGGDQLRGFARAQTVPGGTATANVVLLPTDS